MLLAGDNSDVRDYLSDLLSERYAVDEAQDSDTALTAAHRNPPDLVFADVSLAPVDGLGLLRGLRSDPATSTLPVILLSIRHDEETRDAALEAGADDYLTAPVGASEVLARVEGALGLARFRREAARQEANVEERYRRYFELGLIGMAITSPTKGFVEANDEMCRILGYPREELLRLTWADLTHPDDLAADVAQFSRVMAGECDGYTLDKRFIRKDGQVIDATISVKCVRRADGKPDYFVALLQDITERKRNVAALRLAEERLRLATEAAQIFSWEIDDRTDTVTHAPNTEAVIGFPLSSNRDENKAVVHPDDRAAVTEAYARARQHGEIFVQECRLINPRNGAIVWIRAHGIHLPGSGGRDGRFVGVTQNITDRKLAEEALRASEERNRRLMSLMPAGVYACDRQGRLTFYNRRAAELWGREPRLEDEEEKYCGSFRLWRTDGTYLPHNQTPMAQAIKSGQSVRNHEVVIERPTGSRIVVSVNVDPIYDREGRPQGAVNVFEDITERKRAEAGLKQVREDLERMVEARTAELRRANDSLRLEMTERERMERERRDLVQRLAEVQELERLRISRELHDQLGQDITALLLSLRLWEDSVPSDTAERFQIQRLLSLTQHMGDVTHRLAVELRPASLKERGLEATLEDHIETWSAQTGILVDFQSVSITENRLPFDIETVLYRVVQEGLTNVIKHAQARKVSLLIQRRSHEVLLVLEDDGQGFAIHPAGEHDSQHLGLLGMNERVTEVAGELTMESLPGRGTSLYVRIPLAVGQ